MKAFIFASRFLCIGGMYATRLTAFLHDIITHLVWHRDLFHEYIFRA